MVDNNTYEGTYLVGPFIGELSWEYFRFAPHIIYLKKTLPKTKFVVLTRPERFDFYGSHVDILVPLKLTKTCNENTIGFTIEEFPYKYYEKIIESFIKIYTNNKKIPQIIYPAISNFSYKVKWQFPRNKMDYDFKPRRSNTLAVNKIINDGCVLFDDRQNCIDINQLRSYETKGFLHFLNEIKPYLIHSSVSTWGCYVEALKKCKFVIGNLSSDVSRLALLLKTPVITINEKLSNDDIHLINPLKTPVIKCTDVEEGIKIYEDTF